MNTLSRFVISSILLCCLLTAVAAQDNQAGNTQQSPATVTAFSSSGLVRFTAPSSIVQIRLEVYDSAGKKVFDIEVRGGNVLDWRLLDGQGEPLADESYVCVVTVKSLSGRISERIGSVIIEKGKSSVQAVEVGRLTGQQAQAIGPIEANASLRVLKEDESATATVIAHNGEDGQIVRGTGALSFRIGDFFKGNDREQMRLTAEGNLGIGIAHPTVKLDVDGFIRATQGIVFPDGSIQFSAARRTFGPSSLRPGQSGDHPFGTEGDKSEIKPAIAGTGTTGQIPKWLDGPNGILGDSVITELNGSVGINGPPSSIYRLDVNGHNRFRGSNVTFYLTGQKVGGNEWAFQTVDSDGRLRIFDNTTGNERFSLFQNGNVGIGTTIALTTLTVGGHLTLDAPASPIIYTSSFPGEHNRYLQLINSPSSPSGSGLKAGGILVSDSYAYANPGKNDLIVKGNVGIGTANPTIAKLQVNDSSVGTAVYGNSTIATGVFGQASTALFGGVEGDNSAVSGIGVIGKANASSSVGVYGRSDNGVGVNGISANGFAMRADGNTYQQRDKGGWVKAIVKVLENGTIDRCYNGQTGASLADGTTNTGCGFTVSKFDTSTGPFTQVDLGFKVDDRFWSVTPDSDSTGSNIGANVHPVIGSQTTVAVLLFYTIEQQRITNAPFTLIVY